MASNLFSARSGTSHRSAREIKAEQDRARAEDAARDRAARSAGRDRRSIGKGGGR